MSVKMNVNKTKYAEAVASIEKEFLLIENAVDVGFQQADKWVECCHILIHYVKEKASLEQSYGDRLRKLASEVHSSIFNQDSFPLQFIYMASVEQDGETACKRQDISTNLMGSAFLKPLIKRVHEHRRSCLYLKEIYHGQCNRVKDTEAALQKAKEMYTLRNQELEKWEEERARADATSSSGITLSRDSAISISGSGSGAGSGGSIVGSRIFGRKKSEDGFVQKITEAAETYMKCVDDANKEIRLMGVVEKNILKQLSYVMVESDDVIKSITEGFFNAYVECLGPLVKELTIFLKNCEAYSVGLSAQATLMKHRFVGSDSGATTAKPDVKEHSFEVYMKKCPSDLPEHPRERSINVRGRMGMVLPHISSTTRSSTYSIEEGCINITKDHPSHDKYKRLVSKGISRSLDGSPEPRHGTCSTGSVSDLVDEVPAQSLSLGDLTIIEPLISATSPVIDDKTSAKEGTLKKHHKYKNLRAPRKCRGCEKYVCFNGVQCMKCGLTCHKKCLTRLAFQCIATPLLSPVAFEKNAINSDSVDWTPASERIQAIKTCIANIEENGISVQGVYRLSGSKPRIGSLIEKLSAKPKQFKELLKLEPVHNVTGVLKTLIRMSQDLFFPDDMKEELRKVFRQNCRTDGLDELLLMPLVKTLMGKVPSANRDNLCMLFQHLEKVASNCKENSMPVSNLALILGPTLFYSAEEPQNLDEFVALTKLQNQIVEFFIQNYKTLFDQTCANNTTDCTDMNAATITTTTTSTTTTAAEAEASTIKITSASIEDFVFLQKEEDIIPESVTSKTKISSSQDETKITWLPD